MGLTASHIEVFSSPPGAGAGGHLSPSLPCPSTSSSPDLPHGAQSNSMSAPLHSRWWRSAIWHATGRYKLLWRLYPAWPTAVFSDSRKEIQRVIGETLKPRNERQPHEISNVSLQLVLIRKWMTNMGLCHLKAVVVMNECLNLDASPDFVLFCSAQLHFVALMKMVCKYSCGIRSIMAETLTKHSALFDG